MYLCVLGYPGVSWGNKTVPIICLSTERYEAIFFSFGLVKFSMDKYILAFYLPLDKSKILQYPHP